MVDQELAEIVQDAVDCIEIMRETGMRPELLGPIDKVLAVLLVRALDLSTEQVATLVGDLP